MKIFISSHQLEDNGTIEFVIDNASDKFMDLNNSFLKVKCKIIKANGQNYAEVDKVSLVKLIFSWVERLYVLIRKSAF